MKTKAQDWPEDFKVLLNKIQEYTHAYAHALSFISLNTSRDPNYASNYPLAYLGLDFLQSTLSIPHLANEGFFSVCKRELRFLLEASIKLCFIQQGKFSSSIEEKIAEFKKEISSQNISIKKYIDLGLLTETNRDMFQEAAGRLYGETCDYVHLGMKQLTERVSSAKKGFSPGNEDIEELKNLERLVFLCYSISLVLLFHSVSDYVAGDFFVDENGDTVASPFLASKFIADIDAHFDYKHERQQRLAEIQAQRVARITD